MKAKFIILILIISVSLVSAFQINCDYEEPDGEVWGIKLWSNKNMSEQNKTLVRMALLTEELTENCTLQETNLTEIECKKYFTPVLAILNQNIREKNQTIKTQKLAINIFIVFTIFMLIREIYLWRKENG